MTAKPFLKVVLVAAVIVAAAGHTVSAQTHTTQAAGGAKRKADDKLAILGVLSAYEAALNASDAGAAIQLYAEDGVAMPPNSQSVIGKAALCDLYDTGSKALTFKVKFTVAEVVVMALGWAFARTNSAGALTVHAMGVTRPETNQELFIFKTSADGEWKIARYSFSPTNPIQPGVIGTAAH